MSCRHNTTSKMNTKQYKNHFSKRHLILTSFRPHFDPQNPPKTLSKSIQNPYKTSQIPSHHITSCHITSHHDTSHHNTSQNVTKCHQVCFSSHGAPPQWHPLLLSRRNLQDGGQMPIKIYRKSMQKFNMIFARFLLGFRFQNQSKINKKTNQRTH